MIVYRISKTKYADNISGQSAKKQSHNRWNSFGTPMLYTAENIALCALEIHQYIPPSYPPLNYSLIEIEVPEVDFLIIDKDFFKEPNWIDEIQTTQNLGDYFIESNEYLVMKVPSAMVAHSYNYLINPNHPDFERIFIKSIQPFPLDGKLFRV